METVAPNLTALVGVLVGARLISRVGSLFSLAEKPASTNQVLGSEKALFGGLCTTNPTPKYGFIAEAPLVRHAAAHLKGKCVQFLYTLVFYHMVRLFNSLSQRLQLLPLTDLLPCTCFSLLQGWDLLDKKILVVYLLLQPRTTRWYSPCFFFLWKCVAVE